MSKSGPSAFVVVGDTDWFGDTTTLRHVDIGLDSRLRTIRRDYNTNNWRSALSAGSRAVPHGGRFATLRIVTGNADPAGNAFGLIATGSETTTNYPGSVSGSIGMLGNGTISHNGATVQSGLPTFTTGDVLGVRLYRDSGSLKAQFYKNGATYGTAVTLTDASYRLMSGTYYTATEYRLSVDGDDPDVRAYLPAETQPWGAAARVADVGGYSPAASKFTAAHANITLDAYGRTGTAALADKSAFAQLAPDHSDSSGFFYFEDFVEAATGASYGLIGLGPRTQATSLSFPGAVAGTWGYYAATGEKYTGGVSTAYGSTWGTSDTVGAIWQPSTELLWFTKGTTVQGGGNPQAGTGAAYSGVTGDLIPIVAVWQSRHRLRTQAREQLNRPSYAKAWDGADILPEQHYRGMLKSAPSVRRAITFAPWGGKPANANPIGSLGLINADGHYDRLSESNLRDQACVAYQLRSDGVPAREWAGIVDSVSQPDAETCSVAVASPLSKLDVRVASPVFALGKPERIPATSREGSTITADVSQLTDNAFSVYDKALLVTTWTRDDTADYSGFTRSVAPAGLQSVGDLQVLRTIATLPVLNADLSAWTAGAPDNWTVFVSGGPSAITQNGSAADFFVAAGSGYAEISQGGFTFTAGKRYAFRVNVSAINLGVASSVGTKVRIGASGGESSVFAYYSSFPVAGEHLVFVDCTVSSSTLYLIVDGASGGSVTVTVTQIDAFEADETFTPSKGLAYLMQDIGGLSSSDWSYSDPLSPYSPGQLGYWSNQRPTIRAVVSDLLASLLCDAYPDADGVIQLAWLVPPEEAADGDTIYRGAITESDIFGSVTVEDDLAPSLSVRAEYQHNYVKHSDADIAGSVGIAARQYATSERRENALVLSGTAAGDAAELHSFYAHAEGAPPMPRALVNEFTTSNTPVDGSATVDNRLILLHRCYAVKRRFFRFQISRAAFDTLGLYPGAVLNLTHARYGLSAGKNVMVVSVDQSALSPTVDFVTWG